MRALTTAFLLSLSALPLSAQVPASILGTWHIRRVIPTSNVACWDQDQANTLLGTSLTYTPHTMIWKGGSVPLVGLEAVSRALTPDQLLDDSKVHPRELGLPPGAIREIDLQHEDADVTGATTEIPGDTVLLASPNRIVVSACGVYFEATRLRVKPQ
jgi:hypothetical protein